MPYYINLNGRLTEVSEQEYRLFNVGTSTSPAAGGTETTLNTNQQIINPNTTTTQLTLEAQIAAVAAQQVPSAANAATAEQIAAFERIQANQATPQPATTLSEQIAAVSAAQQVPTTTDAATAEQIAAFERIQANQATPQPTPQPTTTLEQQIAAVSAAQPVTNQSAFPVAYDDEGNLLPGWELNENNDPVFVGGNANTQTVFSPGAVPPSGTGVSGVAYDDDGNLLPGYTLDENNNPVFVGGNFVEPATAASAEASRIAAGKQRAQQQSTLQARNNQPAAADWRVRLQLAPGANYLYKAGNNGSAAGILKPLWETDGVIFPYTPQIDTNYAAKYDSYDLVHSNYRGYFYKSSAIDNITIRGLFTAQDTKEAQYLLAVIHFFRSVTKMFYGQDAQAGTPPPLVYLSGLGQYQFNQHPCVVSSFGYNLPNDVDYIRADGFNNFGINLENRRNLSSGPAPNGTLGKIARLINSGLGNGSLRDVPDPSPVNQNVTNQSSVNSTYVPTKIDLSITLLPMQTRSQVSKQFSLQGFAQGRLLQGGFW